MLSKMGRRTGLALFPAALALLLTAEPAHAQGRCGQHQNGSRQARLQRQNPLQPLLPLQQTTTLQTQLPTQQDPTLVALLQQQNALQAVLQQQNAQMVALQQQNAQLLVQQRRQQQQNALLVGQQVQQLQLQQQNAQLAQARPAPGDGEPAAKPEDPEATAGRKLQIARDLMSDASKAEFAGEGGRAAKMRERAAERLRDVVAKYPGTKAADKAQSLLDKLGV